MKRSFLVLFSLSLIASIAFSTDLSFAAQNIYLAPQKYVYPYPMDGEITFVGYLRELQPGQRVDIEIRLTLPDGTSKWMGPDGLFQDQKQPVIADFPFVAIPLGPLFSTGLDMVLDSNGNPISEFPPGRYEIATRLSSNGDIIDESSEEFWLVDADLVASIVDSPRPIIDSVDPPYGSPGDVITIRGLGLNGLSSLVHTNYVGKEHIKILIGGVEQEVVDVGPDGRELRFRLGEDAVTGDLEEVLAIPYWIEDPEASGHLPVPGVVYFHSNTIPFYCKPVIEKVEPLPFSQGESLTITGKNFAPSVELNQVLFNGVIPATVTQAQEGSLTVTVPATDSFPEYVTVIANSIPSEPFYIDYVKRASIYYVYPRIAAPGGTLLIAGEGFGASAPEVTLGNIGLEASFSETGNVVATIPAGMAPGVYDLTVRCLSEKIVLPRAVTVVGDWR